jgi:ATP-dependent Clp protease protease subunit
MRSGVPPWLEERMFGERIVLLQGTVTAESASRVAAALLTLDTLGSDPVRLHLSATDGDLNAVFAVVDTLDAMRVPVHAIATGEVGGAAVGVLVAARKRLSFPHARFRLAEPRVVGVGGTADEITSAAGRYLQSLEDLVVRVAEVTGQTRSRVEDDFAAGRILTCPQAQEYGLVEAVVSSGRS